MERQGRHLKIAPAHERLGPRGITYRSKSERKFADRLDALKSVHSYGMDWEYEPTVSLAGLAYKPDFVELMGSKILCYHEVKAFRKYKGKLGKISYRAIDVRWPMIKKLWKLHGPSALKVWMMKPDGKFRLIETVMEKQGNAEPASSD